MKYVFGVFFTVVLFLVGCSEKTEIQFKKAAVYFKTVSADSSGINFKNELYYLDDLNIIEYLYYYNEERSHQSLNGMAPNKFNQNCPRIT